MNIYVMITNNCPCHCDQCFVSSGDVLFSDPTREQLNELFRQIKIAGEDVVKLSGGEPFLRHDLEGIAEDAVKNGLTVKINTSGIGVTEKRLKKLKESGITRIGVPLEGYYAQTHDEGKRFVGAHAAAIQTIEMSLQLGFYVEIYTLITKRNCKELAELAIFLSRYNIDKWLFFYYSPVNRGSNHAYLQTHIQNYIDTIESVRKALKREKKEINIHCEWPEVDLNDADGYGCYITERSYLIITPDGNVYPCPLLTLSELHVGNVWKQSLGSILRDDTAWGKFKATSENLKDDCVPDQCKGGCLAYKRIYSNMMYGCDPRCSYSENGKIPVCTIRTKKLEL